MSGDLFDPATYVRLPYREDGRDRRGVDCWGLWRMIVRDVTGIDVGEHGDVHGRFGIARRLADERASGAWCLVPGAQDRALDLVLMTGVGPAGRVAPMHVGCVWRPGVMIDIEAGPGVVVQQFRPTPRAQILPTLANRVLGVYRHERIREWWEARPK